MTVGRYPGRAAFVAFGPERTGHAHYEARWSAAAIFADGGCVTEIENSPHLDDWPDGFADTLPGTGVWIWEGDIVWTGGQTQDGEEYDVRGEGAWRRPNAAEAWRLMRGGPPLAKPDGAA